MHSHVKLSQPAGRRVWWYRVATMTMVPLMLLALAEGALRIAGIGYATCFFEKIAGQDAYTGNPRFGWRFFPRAQSRTPVMLRLPAVTSNNTYRIFLLGSSAALGMPEPAFGVARVLEAMLRATFTNRDVEVVNAAMTAVNSHVVLPIARDCAAHDPDLFIVYEGNNEVVGPFGPGTVFQRWSPGLAGIRARLWMRTTRLGQTMQGLAENAASASSKTEWRGMAMFLENRVTADDPRLSSVRENFRRNLEDICAVAERAGVPIVLSTVAVNLRDSAPFASAHHGEVAAPDWIVATNLEASGKTAEALDAYLALAARDDSSAELHFRTARCAYAMGQFDTAKRAYTRAMELDALRFRTDTLLNETIRTVAAHNKGQGVHLVDTVKHFEQAAAEHHGIPGDEFFYDHVHFNFRGNYELARALFATVAPLLAGGSALPPQPPSQETCAALLAFGPTDELAMEETIAQLMANPPFNAQLGYAERREAVARRLSALRRTMTPQIHTEALAAHRLAVERRPADLMQWNRLAQLSHEAGDFKGALAAWKHLQASLPGDASFHSSAGRTLLSMGERERAVGQFEEALRDTSHPGEICDAVGEEFLMRGDLEEAARWYRRGLAAVPAHADLHNGLGCVFMRQQQWDAALKEFQSAVARSPEHARFRDNLGMTLLFMGRIDEALAELQTAMAMDPAASGVRDHLGYALIRAGRDAEGGRQFEIGLRLDPDHPDLRNHFQEFQRHHAPRSMR